MATKVEGIKFLVVEGKGSEFLAVGFGGGNVEERGGKDNRDNASAVNLERQIR